MTINELTEATREAAMQSGYAFYSGDEHSMNSEIRVYPAAWLVAPKLQSVTGLREGEMTYRATLYLSLMEEGGCTPLNATHTISRLETDALMILARVEESALVRRVYNISCQSPSQPLTTHGSRSVVVSFDAVTLYFKQ
jgi:hypothetical protein